ncbi:putative hydroxypyruvate isomerase [Prorops nasuta]|uniref:putative hydroxypyruvate isomerase n=1 Tax=Prorops nasuta TaxID=863751 RepID=UPI0034CEB135
MSFKFSSNLSFMFFETSNILERYQLAKNAGFKAVESGFPLGYSIDEVVKAKEAANIDHILINVFTGDVKNGELGFAAQPGKEREFKSSIETTINYAKRLNCKMIHVMSGKVESATPDHDKIYESNLLYATKKFEENGIVGVIEPINNITVPNYYMSSFQKGLDIVKRINSNNLKLLVDIFHLQHISGNITHNLNEFFPYIGHIQIAQVPSRHEPDTDGEINYRYVFSLLSKAGYNGYIGLEYVPAKCSVEGLKWIQQFGYKL